MESRNGLHDSSCLFAVLARDSKNLFVMATLGRFYVLGPPVKHKDDVQSVVKDLITCLFVGLEHDSTIDAPMCWDHP